MKIANRFMSFTAVPVKLLVIVTRHSLPNVVLIAIMVIVIAWYNTGFDHELQRLTYSRKAMYTLDTSPQYYLIESYRWLLGIPIAAIIVIDITAISLFTRRWRARRWGRKPPEIERATRYFYP